MALGGRTVAEWQAVMTQSEFLAWVKFYRYFPFDDLHRFHRPAALAGAVGAKNVNEAITANLNWLQPEPVPEGYTLADVNTAKSFGINLQPREN